MAFGLLAVIAVPLGITGPALVHLYDTSVVPCRAEGDCLLATEHVRQPRPAAAGPGHGPGSWCPGCSACSGARRWRPGSWSRYLPAGLDPGRHPKRWLASSSPWSAWPPWRRWAVQPVVTWWQHPFDLVNSTRTSFDQRGMVPLAYAVFASRSGVCAAWCCTGRCPQWRAHVGLFAGVHLA